MNAPHLKIDPPPPSLLCNTLQSGAIRCNSAGTFSLLKFGLRGAPHERKFTLTPDMHLSW